MKVYVSVFGDERGKEVALTGLKSKAKYVQSELGRRMKLRLTPEIRFIEDESLERGSRVRSYCSSSNATISHLILLSRLLSAVSDAYPGDKNKTFTLLQKLSSFHFEHFCLLY